MNNKIVFFGDICSVCASLIKKIMHEEKNTSIFVVVDYDPCQHEIHLNNFLDSQGLEEADKPVWIMLDSTGVCFDGHVSLENQVLLSGADVVFSPNNFNFLENELFLEYVFSTRMQAVVNFLKFINGDHLHYVSSCFSAGCWEGAWTEYDMQKNNNFNNSIERYFSQAERYLHNVCAQSMGGPDKSAKYTVYRLPIVTGDSYSGVLYNCDGLYGEILKSYLNVDLTLHYDKAELFDCVPVDHVANVIYSNVNVREKENVNERCCGFIHVLGVKVGGIDFLNLFPKVERKKEIKHKNRFSFSLAKSVRSMLGKSVVDYSGVLSECLYSNVHVDDFRYGMYLKDRGIPGVLKSDLKLTSCYLDVKASNTLSDAKRLLLDRHIYGDFSLGNMNKVVIDKVEKVCWDNGSGDDIVLLSGMLGPESFFGAANLLKEKYRVIVTDLIGLGPSVTQDDTFVDLKFQASSLKSLISKLNIKKDVILVVSDISAPVAAYFNARWPHLIKSIVYLNPEVSSNNFIFNVDAFDESAIDDIVSLKNNKINFVDSLYFSKNIINRRDRLNYNRLMLLVNGICNDKNSIISFFSAIKCICNESDVLEYFSSKALTLWSTSNINDNTSSCIDTLHGLNAIDSLSFIPDSSIDFYEENPKILFDYVVKNFSNVIKENDLV